MIQYVNLVDETICAPITATGYSGVAVVRVSGEKALEFTRLFCSFLPKDIESHKIYLGKFSKEATDIDQVLVSYFKKGSSFTGDEVIEISCHGSPLVVNQIINEYLKVGCRSAEKGEFSFRAFFNGKIDLVQAESIQNLITSKNNSSSVESLKQLDGNLSQIFSNLEDQLVLAISHLEAAIDFVEQDLGEQEYSGVVSILDKIIDEDKKLINTYDIGKNLLRGYQVLLVGETNVGKSSLFNKLFHQEKAIVTDISGTTRDLISSETFLGSVSVEFTDSAGLRESSDKVEAIGIQKTLDKVKESNALLVVLDASKPINFEVLEKLPKEKSFYVFNKMDLVANKETFLKETEKSFIKERTFYISAINGDGLDSLKKGILNYIENENTSSEGMIITQARHFNHLSALLGFLKDAKALLLKEESPDLISQELQAGLMEIQKLLGKDYDDQILDKIFSEFCVGK